jgi:antitoxin HicB
MKTEYSYPLTIEQDTAGFYLVTFPDVPEAGSDAETEVEVLAGALDSLIAALGGYINQRRDIPKPSPAKRGQKVIALPSLAAAKLVLYQALCETGMTNVELGRLLGVSETAVRHLLDLDHRSPIGQVEAALEILGRRLVVTVEAA